MEFNEEPKILICKPNSEADATSTNDLSSPLPSPSKLKPSRNPQMICINILYTQYEIIHEVAN
jgi:hypothetical protein